MGLGVGKKMHYGVKTAVPHQKRWKKCRFRPIRAVFQRFRWGTAVFTQNCRFFLPNPRPIAELQSYVSFFENSSVGPRSIYVSAVIWGKTGQKVGNGDKKRGQIFLPPKIITTFYRLEI